MCFIVPLAWTIGFSNALPHKNGLSIKIRKGVLYIKVNAVPLDMVLREISRKTKVKIIAVGSLKDKVTFKSRKLPLDQVVIKLIEGKADYMFVYQQPSILREAWIFSRSKDVESQKGLSNYSLQEDLRPGDHLLEDVEDMESKVLLSTSVEDLLQSQDADIRIKVIKTLGELKGEQALELLVSALNDEDEDVRESAVWALGEIGDVRAVEPLIARLKDEEAWVRASAAEALAKIGDQSGLSYLVESLDVEKDEDVRKALEEALDRLTR